MRWLSSIQGMSVAFHFEHPEHPADIDALELSERLLRFNLSRRGGNWQVLLILVRDEQGKIAGGIAGGSRWGRGEIETLWLEEEARGQGLGRSLLERAERDLRNRGCRWVDLETFEFQAPDFYRKAGYQALFELETSPEGGARKFWMRKHLTDSVEPAAP